MTSRRERAFVSIYLAQAPQFNGAEAARQAGYAPKSARVTASKLLAKPNIQAIVQEHLDRLKANADEVLMGLAEHARGSMADFVSFDKRGKPKIDLNQAAERGKLHLVKKIKITEKHGNITEYTTEIELYDAQAAKIALGKNLRLFTEKIEVDWVREFELAGLDAHAEEQRLIEEFKRHLLSSGAEDDAIGTGEGQTAT